MGTYRSFVEPLLGVKDIHVLSFSLATKVLFEGDKAVGIQVKRFGKTLTYKVNNKGKYFLIILILYL
jgi:hypothetical protein